MKQGQVLLAILFVHLGLWAQVGDKYQVNLIVAPSLETYSAKTAAAGKLFQEKFSYNFGAEYKYFLDPTFAVSAGLQFQDKGFRSTFTFDTNDSTQIGEGLIAVSTRYLNVPLLLNHHWQIARKTELVLDYGPVFGYLVKQSLLGKRIPEDLGQEIQFLEENITNNRTDIEWFNKAYFGVFAGLGVQQYVASRLVLVANMGYTKQFNRTIDPDGPLVSSEPNFNPRFNSIILQLKMGWYFNKQIQNDKKVI